LSIIHPKKNSYGNIIAYYGRFCGICIFSLPYLFKFALDARLLQPSAQQVVLPDFMVKKHNNANVLQYENIFLKTGIAIAVLYFIIIFSLMFYTKNVELPLHGQRKSGRD
jgi:hypothetical protein